MKESKGVYVTKRDIRQNLQHIDNLFYANDNVVNTIEVNKYKLTNDVGIQYNSKRDNILYAHRNFSNVRRYHDHDLRYFNPIPKQIFSYSRSRSFTDIGVGSVKALQKKKVKKIYLPETDDRGVGSSELITFITRMQSLQNKSKSKQYRTEPYRTYYDSKKTSSKCVGGAVEYRPECLVSAKVSPILHTQSGSTSPKDPGLFKSPKESKDSKDIEIGSTIIEKHFVTTDTQFEEPEVETPEPYVQEYTNKTSERSTHIIKPSAETVEAQVVSVAVVQPEQKPPKPNLEVVLPEKRSKRPEPLKGSFSSDSLVQHVHNLEQPSEHNKQRDPMENKMEREYRKMFASVSRDDKTVVDQNVEQKQVTQKSTSLFRRRFTAIRKSLGKKASKSGMGPNQTSVPSVRDVSVTSDPPSLEEKSFSSMNGYSVSPGKIKPKMSHTNKKSSKTWSKANAIDSEYGQGVKGMFKLWGKKFNLDDTSDGKEELTQRSSFEDKPKEKGEELKEKAPKEKEQKYSFEVPLENVHDEMILEKDKEKKEGKKFFFFKKKLSKDKTKNQNQSYKSKKGVMTGRCEVKDGLSIRMGAARTPFPIKNKTSTLSTAFSKEISTPVDDYDLVRAAWLMKYLSNPKESRNSVKIRWNNKTYTTSSSTVFELMGNVYKNTGVVLTSKSEITTDLSSSGSFHSPNVNFVQQIEAWMVPNTITNKKVPVILQIRSENFVVSQIPETKSENDNKNIEVTLSDQKWIIDKSKAFAHKVEVVLHSKNFVKLQKPETSAEYLRIDIPKGFFTDSSSDEPQHEHTSDEEVYNIVEYESGHSEPQLKYKTKSLVSNSGDHGSGSDNIKVIVSVKSGVYKESTILEPVAKKLPVLRDVVIQGSNVYIPKMCDVIGVGIITQRDVRETGKPMVMEYLSEGESEHSLLKQCTNNSEFARSYLQEYYRHWQPLGLDMFSWCVSDSHMQCCSEHNSKTSYNNGDTTKSCPNIFEEFVTMVSSYSSGGCQHPTVPCNNDNKENKDKKPKKEKDDKVEEKTNYKDASYRVLPKDSLEVFKKRKIYALEKLKWVDEPCKPYSVPSNAETRVQGKVDKSLKNVKRVGLTEPKNNDCIRGPTQNKERIIKTSVIACTINDPCCMNTSCSSLADICGIDTKTSGKCLSSCEIPCGDESITKKNPPLCLKSPSPSAEGKCQQPPPPGLYKSSRRDQSSRDSSKGFPSPEKCCKQRPTSPPKSPPIPMCQPIPPIPPCAPLPPICPHSPPKLHASPPRDQQSPTSLRFERNTREPSLCQNHVMSSPSSPKHQASTVIPDSCHTMACPAMQSSKSPPCSCNSASVHSLRSSTDYSLATCELPQKQCNNLQRWFSKSNETQTPSECPPSPTQSPLECPSSQYRPKCTTHIKLSNSECVVLPKRRKYGPPPSRPYQTNSPIASPCSPKTPPYPPPCPPNPPKTRTCPHCRPKTPPNQCKSSPRPPSPPKSPHCSPNPPKTRTCPHCQPKTPPNQCKSSPRPPSPPKSPPSPSKSPPSPPKSPPCSPKTQSPPPRCPPGFKFSNTNCVKFPKPKKYANPCSPPKIKPCKSPPLPPKTEPCLSKSLPSPPKSRLHSPKARACPHSPPRTKGSPPKSPPRPQARPCPHSPPKSPPCPQARPCPHSPPKSPPCPLARPCPHSPPKSPPCPHKTKNLCPTPHPTKTPPCKPKTPPCVPLPDKCPQGLKISNTNCEQYPKPRTYGTSSSEELSSPCSPGKGSRQIKDTSNTASCCKHQPCCKNRTSQTETRRLDQRASPCYIHISPPLSCMQPKSPDKSLQTVTSPTDSDIIKIERMSQSSSTQGLSPSITSLRYEYQQCSEDCPKLVTKCKSVPQQRSENALTKPLVHPKSTPNLKKKISRRLTGIFLKKYPRKISNTNVIRLNSKENIRFKLKDDNISTHEMRGGHVKIKDDDNITIIERKDYKQSKQTLFNNIYKDSKMNRIAAPITVNEIASVVREKELTECKSTDSIVNMIEINFKLRVIQGDKTTEINIANEDSKVTTDDTTQKANEASKVTTDDSTQKPNRKTCDDLDVGAKQVYILKDEDAPEELNPKNDLNIRILIKNYKPKTETSIKKKAVDDFSQKISKKFNTVSTGYSVDLRGEPTDDTCFSIHRATIDLTTSERSKSTIPSKQVLFTNKSEVKFKDRKKISDEILSHTFNDTTSRTENMASTTEADSKMSLISGTVPLNLILPTMSEHTKSVSSGKRILDQSSVHSVFIDSKRSSKNIDYVLSKSLHRSSRSIQRKWSRSDEGSTTEKTFDKTESISFKESKKAKVTDIFKTRSFTDTDERDTSLGNKTSDEPTDLLLYKTSDVRPDAIAKSSEDRTDCTDYGKMSEDPNTSSEILIIPTEETDYIDLGKSRKEEKKTMLKQIFDNANYFNKPKNKNRIQKLKDMLKALLTSDETDSDPERNNINSKISNKITWDPNTKHNSDSLNNFFEGGSMLPSQTHTNNCDSLRGNGSVYSVDEDKPKNKTCICSTFSEKLNLGNIAGGGCCCRRKLPEQVSEQISCNFINELSLEDYSYFAPSVECVHCQTNNSRYKSSIHCAKIVSITSRKTSFITPRSQKTSFIIESDNMEIEPLNETLSYKTYKHEREIVENISREGQFLHEEKITLEVEPVPTKMSPKSNKKENEFKEKSSHDSHYQEIEIRRFSSTKTDVGISGDSKVLHNKAKNMSDKREINRKKKKHHTRIGNQADVLQMYETKKAVLEIYAEKTVTDDEEHLVAKLPKFIHDTESQLCENYEQLDRNNYNSVYKRNFVMMCIGR